MSTDVVPPPPDRPDDLRPLEVGELAWMLLGRPAPSGKSFTLAGGARVVVLEVSDATYRVRIVTCSSGAGIVGDRRDGVRRAWLYACRDRAEHAAFGQLVRFFLQGSR